MRLVALLVVASLGLAPQAIAKTSGHKPPAKAPAHGPSASTMTATVQGVTATFRFTVPTHPLYTCAMHPRQQSAKPGKCPLCGMTLEKQTRLIGVTLAGAGSSVLAAGRSRLDIVDADVVPQSLLVAKGRLWGGFCLKPGKYTVKATFTPSSGSPAAFTVPYTVR